MAHTPKRPIFDQLDCFAARRDGAIAEEGGLGTKKSR